MLILLHRLHYRLLSRNDKLRRALPISSNMAQSIKLQKNESVVSLSQQHILSIIPKAGITLTSTVLDMPIMSRI